MNMILVEGIVTEWKAPAAAPPGAVVKTAVFVDSYPVSHVFPAGVPEEVIRPALLAKWTNSALATASAARKNHIYDLLANQLLKVEVNPASRYSLKAPLVL
jgi:hypothetical protein